MFSTTWKTSERKYNNIICERDVRIPMSDGIELSADIFRPDSADHAQLFFVRHLSASR